MTPLSLPQQMAKSLSDLGLRAVPAAGAVGFDVLRSDGTLVGHCTDSMQLAVLALQEATNRWIATERDRNTASATAQLLYAELDVASGLVEAADDEDYPFQHVLEVAARDLGIDREVGTQRQRAH